MNKNLTRRQTKMKISKAIKWAKYYTVEMLFYAYVTPLLMISIILSLIEIACDRISNVCKKTYNFLSDNVAHEKFHDLRDRLHDSAKGDLK